MGRDVGTDQLGIAIGIDLRAQAIEATADVQNHFVAITGSDRLECLLQGPRIAAEPSDAAVIDVIRVGTSL